MTQRAIGCEEAVRLLAAWLDRELDSADHTAVSLHLEACRSCCSRAEFEQRLRQHLIQLRRAPVDPGLEQRVRLAIQGFEAARSEATQP